MQSYLSNAHFCSFFFSPLNLFLDPRPIQVIWKIRCLSFVHFFMKSYRTPADLPIQSYPLTYKENDNKEKLVLAYSENFRRQYVHLYRDRKPLLLCPLNECGVEKFVCTTIRPTTLPFQELYDYDGCAEFVSDYVTFDPLDPPVDLVSNVKYIF